ncbi:MAG: thioesterase II family protein [Cyanobacteria bacterium P01_F01_bin.86]
MMRASSNSWITCPKPNPQASLRLFCFPYAGGGALSFRSWSAQLSSTIEVCPIELPGRGMRLSELPLTQLPLLVEGLIPSLLPCLDKPFAFFGHSMGGLMSFEVARFLRRSHAHSPAHLFVSGHCAPQIPCWDPSICTLSDADFIQRLRHLNGTSETALDNEELMQLLLPAFRADFAVLANYSYQLESPLNCPITAFGGLQDPGVSREMLEGWQKQTSSAFTIQMFLGDHFFIHTAQSLLLQSLAQTLSRITNDKHPLSPTL